ncbi:MAG: hypothetical protein LC790_10500, partial [Actinobacteria bacterium]|nr:hypothetical protein [Actinomycetota bacterium]
MARMPWAHFVRCATASGSGADVCFWLDPEASVAPKRRFALPFEFEDPAGRRSPVVWSYVQLTPTGFDGQATRPSRDSSDALA